MEKPKYRCKAWQWLIKKNNSCKISSQTEDLQVEDKDSSSVVAKLVGHNTVQDNRT